jgi:hypothetical protein
VRSPRRVFVPHSLREQEGRRTSSARARGDRSVPRGAGGLGEVRGLCGSRGTVGAAVLPARGGGVPEVWGAGARVGHHRLSITPAFCRRQQAGRFA